MTSQNIIDEYIDRILADAPPLTQETADRVVSILKATSPAGRINH